MKTMVIEQKAKDFAVRSVYLYKYLCDEQRETVMSKQILRSGTSIGANIHEALFAESKADLLHKYAVAQKECSETLYWLDILYTTKHITEKEYHSLLTDCEELMKILVATIKTIKKSLITNH